MKKINLVTGNSLNLWDKKKRNVLINEWCIDKKESFYKKKGFEFIVQNYHWTDEKLQKDIIFIYNTYDKLLKEISIILNNIHKLNKPQYYWELLIFNWLWQFILFTFDRWEMVKSAEKRYQKIYSKHYQFKDESFCPDDNEELANKLIYSKSWNHFLFNKIIYFSKNIKLRQINKNKKYLKIFSETKKIKKNIIFPTTNNSKIFLKDLQYPRGFKSLLNLSYGQFKMFYSNPGFSKSSFNSTLRKKKFVFKKSNNDFYNFLKYIIPISFPKVYLEGYKNLGKELKKLDWPKNPKIIITSISHYTDPIFRYYVAKKRLEGSKFVIVQHGGKYGYTKFRMSEYFEKKISDRFLTWGNYKKDKKTRPLHVSSIVNQKSYIKFDKSKILMTNYEFPFIFARVDGYPRGYKEVINHKKFLKNFISSLQENIVNKLDIKNFLPWPKGKNVDFFKNYSQIERDFKVSFPSIRFFNNNKRAYEIRNNYRLQIETVDGTGFLEALSLNNPTILIYNQNFFKLDDKAKKYFKKLEECKIIFTNPGEAANFLNRNYNKLDKWWFSSKLQKNRKTFCNMFASHPQNPLTELRKNLVF